MAIVTRFVPCREIAAKENVNRFVEMARHILTMFGENLDWEAERWSLGEHFKERAGYSKNILWSDFDSLQKRNNKTLMKSPFLDFAKAYIRYIQSIKKSKNIGEQLSALRAIEKSLSCHSNKPCVSNVNINTLTVAEKYIKDAYAKNNAFMRCRHIAHISDFLNDNEMLNCPRFKWKTGLKSAGEHNFTGEKYDIYREDKLPTDTAIYAIADIHSETNDPMYKIVTSIAVLLFSFSSRIGELLTLDKDCMVEDHEGILGALGIRFFPEKGGEPYIKPVLPIWRELVRETIQEILLITEDARSIAQWYENNPDKMYLPAKHEWIRKERYIKLSDVDAVLGGGRTCAGSLCKKHNIPRIRFGGHDKYIAVQDLETIILANLPDFMPYNQRQIGLKYSKSLFVFRKDFFSTRSCAFGEVMFAPIKANILSMLYSGKRSIFARLGFFEPNGEVVKFNTHSARHWHDTVADGCFIPQIHRAFFAGRKNIRHNAAYSHACPVEKSDKAIEIDNQSDISPRNVNSAMKVFSQPEVMAHLLRVQYEEIVHITDVGFCLMGPGEICMKYSDHILCKDHLYIKGDKRLDVIRLRIKFLEKQNEIWRKDSDNVGFDVSLKHNEQILSVLKGIQAVLDDTRIPDECFFGLRPGKDYSQILISYYQKNKRMLGRTAEEGIPLVKVGALCLDI